MEDGNTCGGTRKVPVGHTASSGEWPTGGGRGTAPKSARAATPRSRQNARRARALRGCRVCQAANENRPIACLSKLGGSSQAGGGRLAHQRLRFCTEGLAIEHHRPRLIVRYLGCA